MRISKAVVAVTTAFCFSLPIAGSILLVGSQFHPPAHVAVEAKGAGTAIGRPAFVREEVESFWEKWSDPVAQGTLGLIVVTGLLAIFTYRLYRTAVTSSREARDASKEALDSAKETTRRQLRAYPGITGADIRIYGNDVKIGLKVQNFSTTPAYKFKYAIGALVCELEATDGVLEAVESESVWDMAPRSTTTMKCELTLSGRDETLSVVRGQKVIVIAGRADYEDAFDGKRWITFRYRTIPFFVEKVEMFQPDGTYRPVLVQVCTEPEAIEYDSN